jgi:hypothetical protein
MKWQINHGELAQASFAMTANTKSVVKLLRVYGGCLGVQSL